MSTAAPKLEWETGEIDIACVLLSLYEVCHLENLLASASGLMGMTSATDENVCTTHAADEEGALSYIAKMF